MPDPLAAVVIYITIYFRGKKDVEHGRCVRALCHVRFSASDNTKLSDRSISSYTALFIRRGGGCRVTVTMHVGSTCVRGVIVQPAAILAQVLLPAKYPIAVLYALPFSLRR